MTADIQKLPSLPGSDHETLVRNRVDSFYGKKPSDFWQGYVENTKIEKPKKCKHYFEETKDGVKCKNCNMGLIGNGLIVKNGHIFFNNQKLI